ncbi:MAG: hypothetical protein WCJ58_04920 [bacterium]
MKRIIIFCVAIFVILFLIATAFIIRRKTNEIATKEKNKLATNSSPIISGDEKLSIIPFKVETVNTPYITKSGGFSFKYPKSWSIDTKNIDEAAYIKSDIMLISSDQQLKVFIASIREEINTKNCTPDSPCGDVGLIRQYYNFNNTEFEEIAKLDQQSILISKIGGNKLDYSGETETINAEILQPGKYYPLLQKNNEKVTDAITSYGHEKDSYRLEISYYIGETGSAENWPAYREQLGLILQSFMAEK